MSNLLAALVLGKRMFLAPHRYYWLIIAPYSLFSRQLLAEAKGTQEEIKWLVEIDERSYESFRPSFALVPK